MDVLRTLLLPVGWLVTGVALVYADRFLDRRIEGSSRKRAGAIPFWWVFVWAAAAGWGSAMITTDDSPAPAVVQAAVLVILLVAAITAFWARFGLRPRLTH